jgi:hypothetical protein
MDYALILSKKFEGQSFSVGETYQSIVSLDGSPIPAEAELEALWPTVQHEVAYAQVEQARQQAYQQTADPLFFKYQAGSATKEEWEAERQRIKDSLPYPENPGDTES